ncbi:hypothetical protein GYMLUDRAFT_52999 [Collybiopsis luxurians FD-317 M1]|nr:hypothetical protein GYMLUDRAFT_52999 [Collybiopsis luxurians FD-317 M1]
MEQQLQVTEAHVSELQGRLADWEEHLASCTWELQQQEEQLYDSCQQRGQEEGSRLAELEVFCHDYLDQCLSDMLQNHSELSATYKSLLLENKELHEERDNANDWSCRYAHENEQLVKEVEDLHNHLDIQCLQVLELESVLSLLNHQEALCSQVQDLSNTVASQHYDLVIVSDLICELSWMNVAQTMMELFSWYSAILDHIEVTLNGLPDDLHLFIPHAKEQFGIFSHSMLETLTHLTLAACHFEHSTQSHLMHVHSVVEQYMMQSFMTLIPSMVNFVHTVQGLIGNVITAYWEYYPDVLANLDSTAPSFCGSPIPPTPASPVDSSSGPFVPMALNQHEFVPSFDHASEIYADTEAQSDSEMVREGSVELYAATLMETPQDGFQHIYAEGV